MSTCRTCGAYGLTIEPPPSEAQEVVALLERLHQNHRIEIPCTGSWWYVQASPMGASRYVEGNGLTLLAALQELAEKVKPATEVKP